MDALLIGALAGYGVAVPVGAIAVLILDTAARGGLRIGLAAGAGTAVADLAYAIAAALGGSAIALALKPWEQTFRWAAAGVLLAVAVRLLALARRPLAESADPAGRGRSLRGTFARFLGLTIVNPTTAASFAAVVIGMGSRSLGLADGAVFALAAFLASLSWQWLIAIVGAVMHRRLPPSARRVSSLVGALVIGALAVRLVVL